MSSLIGNQVKKKTNILVLIKFSLLIALLMCHCLNLYTYIAIITTITACLTQPFVILLTTFSQVTLVSYSAQN